MLYRFYDADNVLLYVGITMNPSQRWKSHSEEKAWWFDVATVRSQRFDSREEVLKAERQAIRSERPLHNVVHNAPPAAPKPKREVVTVKERVDWRCDECGELIANGDGFIYVLGVREAEKSDAEWKAFRQARKVANGGFDVISGDMWQHVPERAKWKVCHRKCDPIPDQEPDYWFDVATADSPRKMVDWAAHMLSKHWLKVTDWDRLLFRSIGIR